MIKQLTEKKVEFNSLSVKDLLEARDLFHVHLMNKANVVGTAIGRYRIRDVSSTEKRTLSNSSVKEKSWPCILVFVSEWKTDEELKRGDITEAIPQNIYMPDGRIVPICVIEAPKQDQTDAAINESELEYPGNVIGGGYPLMIENQGLKKIASAGCLVTDGNKYYVLTNKPVTGTPGEPIFTKIKDSYAKIGTTTSINIGNSLFQAVYDDWIQPKLFVNVDVGLIEVDDINIWKTDIYGLGPLGEVLDINARNISLQLIGTEVAAHGAVSGNLSGEIAALFFRYKSIGGYEYVADFLIGPSKGQTTLNTKHGDSGTIWTVPVEEDDGSSLFLPIAIQWGQRTVIGANKNTSLSFALATNLSHVCRDLDVEIVRDWNLGLDYTWGKIGHFKVGFAACDLVGGTKLKKLLKLNADNIGVNDNDLIAEKFPAGLFTEEFVSMTDVADMYWRTKRKADASNHFADMDDQHEDVYDNKRLLDLCFTKKGVVVEEWLDATKWLDFYQQLDIAKPDHDKKGKLRKRLGALPFRIWQMYNEMVDILGNGDSAQVKLAKFVVAGGTMSHYVGDACQPLHISYLHDGYPDGEGAGVHSAYETNMLNSYSKKASENFLSDISSLATKVDSDELIKGGRGAARLVLSLMWDTYHLLPPKDIVDNYIDNRSIVSLWEEFGDRTKQTIANGAHTMAVIWQSAWKEGKGNALDIPTNAFTQPALMKWYKKPSFVQSYKLDDSDLWPLLV